MGEKKRLTNPDYYIPRSEVDAGISEPVEIRDFDGDIMMSQTDIIREAIIAMNLPQTRRLFQMLIEHLDHYDPEFLQRQGRRIIEGESKDG